MKYLYQFWQWLLKRLPSRKRRPYVTKFVEDSLPKNLENYILYIVQDDDFLEQAAMLCPCGCASVLHMNLIPDEHPCWKFISHPDGTSTLHPSVWRKVGCESHFWFRQGYIHWC